MAHPSIHPSTNTSFFIHAWMKLGFKAPPSQCTKKTLHSATKVCFPGPYPPPPHRREIFYPCGNTSAQGCFRLAGICGGRPDSSTCCSRLDSAHSSPSPAPPPTGAACSGRPPSHGPPGSAHGDGWQEPREEEEEHQPDLAPVHQARGGALQDRAEGELPKEEEEEERDSKGQSKRKSLRALNWGTQLATLSPSQLRKAIRWASLDEEVYEAVMLVKSLGPNVKNGKRRQFNYIGGILRDADPELMEQVLTACQDGDLSGLMARMNIKPELSEDETDAAYEKREYLPEEEKIAGQWLQGLLDGDEAVNNDVFSSTSDVYFDRQELKKLMRLAKAEATDRSVEATKAHNALFDFLYDLAQRRKNDA